MIGADVDVSSHYTVFEIGGKHMFSRTILTAAWILLPVTYCLNVGGALAQSETDPAPSGAEVSETFVDPDTGRTLTLPGRKAPVVEGRNSDGPTLDFDPDGSFGTESSSPGGDDNTLHFGGHGGGSCTSCHNN